MTNPTYLDAMLLLGTFDSLSCEDHDDDSIRIYYPAFTTLN